VKTRLPKKKGDRGEGRIMTIITGIMLNPIKIFTSFRFMTGENSFIIIKLKNPIGESKAEDHPILVNIDVRRGLTTKFLVILRNNAPNTIKRVKVPNDNRIRLSFRWTSWIL
jgi:hypothetical protein